MRPDEDLNPELQLPSVFKDIAPEMVPPANEPSAMDISHVLY